MAKAGVRRRNKGSAKSATRGAERRKPGASKKAISARSGKAFMLKDKTSEGEKLIVKPDNNLPKPRRKSAARSGKVSARAAAKAAAPTVLSISAETPLPRAQAPVVWQKVGPLDNVRYWLRAWGRSLSGKLRNGRKVQPPTQAPIGAKLRSKNDLLREIAVLRQENAIMRTRLGLPPLAGKSPTSSKLSDVAAARERVQPGGQA